MHTMVPMPLGVATSKISQSYDVFLCSADFAEQNGGTAGIVDLARGMKAKKLMIIGHDDSDQFFVYHEMNGKAYPLTIPVAAEKTPIATNYSLQWPSRCALMMSMWLLPIQLAGN